MKKIAMMLLAVLALTLVCTFATSVKAAGEEDAQTTEAAIEEESEGSATGTKAVAAAAVVGVVAAAGAIAMAIAIGKSVTGMSRQPEAAGQINGAMMLGLVFIETAIIYALIVAILIIFVL